ncbi:hypothetical protein [Sphaerimonospora mesophila]
MRFSYTFDLCFGTTFALSGQPLLPTIPALIQEIESSVSPLIDMLD